MGHQVTIGGERLGAGKRSKVDLHGYERSTHNLGYVWRSTAAAGTLIPFMSELALPGDTHDIDLNVDVLTHPTIGPLFGTYKIQLDVFAVPIRLYQAKLHMNLLGIGLDMSQIKLPQVDITGPPIRLGEPLDNQQINPSCIFSYLNIRGVGYNATNTKTARNFNAIPYLAYWDIYKNYYANKQEEIGAVIHKDPTPTVITITAALIQFTPEQSNSMPVEPTAPSPSGYPITTVTKVILTTNANLSLAADAGNIILEVTTPQGTFLAFGREIFQNWTVYPDQQVVIGSNPTTLMLQPGATLNQVNGTIDQLGTDQPPQVVTFPLENIDTMRKTLLSNVNSATAYQIGSGTIAPYGLPLESNTSPDIFSQTYNQEGLALKTYNSDLFNNWISTEWIDGADGISEITAIDTSGGSFTIDELNLSRKIYDMLNRIAISGGSYDDWLDAVYDHDRQRSAENPMYVGGLIDKLVFQEVISNSATPDEPLGTLAGRGRVLGKQKGGKIVVKTSEPSYIMGIFSLTPNIDYSQGNKWDVNLKTMNDLHKPALDEIGFQDLITDQMAWYDTFVPGTEGAPADPTYKSAGKQPAWINYMTNVNVIRGNFADETQQMFMVLNRRYGVTYTGNVPSIKDLTTYIDPTKFNHIFADTRLDAQNFWVQIGVEITARRKMSAKIMPNL